MAAMAAAGWSMQNLVIEAPGQPARDWLEQKVAELHVEAKQLSERFLKEKPGGLKIWPYTKTNRKRFLIIWNRVNYHNIGKKVMRTKHISKGRGDQYDINRLIKHSGVPVAEQQWLASFIEPYEVRFAAIRRQLTNLSKMLFYLDRYEKELSNGA